MAQAQVIAKVSSMSGEAFARDSSGKMRRLKVGDSIREGESVVSSDGSQVVLKLADGREMTVRPGEVARIDAEVGAPIKPDAADSAVINNPKGFQKIAKAITGGGDLDSLLEQEAPAAGAVGTGGNEGHTFVEFLRVVETVDPLAFQFGTGLGRTLQTIEGGAAILLPTSVAVTAQLAPASDSALKGDSITNDNTPTLNGTGTPGANISVVSPTGEVMTTVVAPDGRWSVTPSTTIPDGPVTFTVKATDDFGNSASATVAATIDTVANGTITIDPVTPDNILTAAEAGQNINLTGVVGGEAKPGDVVTLTVNGKQFTGLVLPGMTYSISVPGSDLAADGDKVVEAAVSVEDVAGNVAIATANRVYAPAISVGDVSVSEGAPAEFTVTLDAPYSGPASMQLVLGNTATPSDVDAIQGVDFQNTLEVSFNGGTTWVGVVAGLVTVPAGVTSYLVRVQTSADEPGKVFEGPETFTLSANLTTGTQVATGTATIKDDGTGVPPGGGTPDDDRPTISVGSDFTVDEAAGTITFTVTKTGSTSLPATVSFTTQDGTAIAGSDYSPASGTLTFAAGETTKQVTVSITNDAIYEGAQDFNLVISNPVNAKLGDAVQTVTIVDDGTGVPPGGGTPDDDRPVFTIGNDLIIDEKAGTATFTVTKTGATTLTSSVSFGTSDAGATAGQDYTANNGVLTFGANETTKTITIQIANDTTYEVSEGFKVTLSAPTNGVLGAVKEVTGTIVDDGRTLPGGGTADDDRPGFSINDLIIDESAGTVTFTVTRTGDLTQAASVDYAPQNGSATGGGVDFNLTGGTLNFAPNMATQTITVTINNDGTYEGPEGFVINLSNPVGAVITDGQGAGTIVDNGTGVPPGGGTPDDDRPTISVGSDFTVDEAAGTITFTVTKTGSTSLPATVSFTTQDGTAIAGSDYSPASGTLTFAAGETTKQVTVSITNDAIYEGAQDFNLVISNPVNAKLGDAVQTVTIVDDGTGVPPGGGTPDDDRPVFTIGNDLIIDEKAGTATFTVTKTGATTLTSSVSFGTSDAGATAGQDYTANNGVLTFGANETTKTITIQIANDTTYEVSEGFKVTLSAPTNGVLGAVKEVTGTIVDDGRTLPGGGTADDDRPGFSINDLIIDESAGTVTFTVTRTGDLTQAASVDYAPQNGSATGGGVDFNLTGGTLNFAPNMATQTITVTINNDGTYEGPEGFVINLSNPVGAVITDGQGAGTIVDNGTGVPPGGGTPDDDRPTISVGSDFTVDEAAGTITFTVTKTGSTSLPATVSFTTQDGTAIAGSDYSPASGTLTFAAGETTKQVTVSITNDAIYEGAQDFNLVISNPVNAKLGDAVQTVTIVDDGTGVPPGGGTPDDDRPVFTIGNDLIIDEKAGTATFTVTKTGATTLTSSVSFGTSDAGATAGQDYTANNGVLTFGANETTKTITIQIANDTTYEVSEGFKVTLSAPTNGVLGAVKEVTGTIVDDGRTLPGGGTADDDRPGFSINDLIIDESAGTVTFTVTRTGDLTQAASVDYAPQNGSATGGGVDFNLTGGTLNFAPNMATQTITVTINNDGTYEGPEGFVINLSNPVGAVITDGQGAGTIVDNGTGVPPGGGTPDDDRPTISVGSDFTVDEAAGTITFTVTKTGSTSLPATVSFTTQDGTAIAGSDYSPASGTLTFAAGETTKQVTVSITNDAIYEGAQDFNLVISNPVNAKLGDAVQTVTIVDDGTGVPPGGGTPDDDRPVFTIGNDLIIDEKAGTATFTVTKTGATTLTSSVSFGTSDAGATAGQDYTANNGVLTFGANETTKTITIQIANDTTYEVSEGFKVTLSAPTNGVLGAVKEVTGTIVDDGRTLPGGGTADDDRPGFSINDLIIDESAGTVTFTVTRTGDLTQAASVDYAPQNGSATGGGVDFNLTGGTLNFAPNMATQTITVTINNDGTYEGPEGFVINLSNPVGAVITDGQGAGTIVDNGTGVPPGGGTPDDDRPTISVGSDFTVDEAAGTITFTVTKTGSTSLPATVSFTTQDGTAIAGSDYSPASGTLTFAAGETTKQVTVSITNDAIYEGAQDFNLVISNPVNAKLGDAVQTVTIVDDGTGVPPGGGTPDDDRPVFTIGNDLIIDEKAGTATFTVTKTGATTLTSSVSFGTSDAGATAGQDYTANNGVLTFGANETTKTITIQIANDTTYEVSEGFKVTLSAPTNGVLGAVKEVTGTIVDDGRTLPGGGTADDDRPGFSINDLIIDESAGTVTFTVTRTGDLTQAASVDYAPQNGSATGGGVDFNLTGGTLNFAPNMATQTITVTINNDGTYEGPEGFVINLSNPVGAVITDGQGAGTIVDNGTGVPPGGGTPDDDRPTISVGSDFTVDEAAGTITFTVTKTGSTSLPATVSFTTQDGTAIAGSDYSPASGTLTFAAGETTKQVTVSITNDAIYEGAQDFNLVISNPVNAKLGDAVQTVTIVDDGTGVPPGGGTPDDDRPVFTIGNDLIIDEKAGTATFTVTKTGATTLTSSVSFGTSDAGATAGQDYTANNGVLTFGANETTKTITIQIANDTTYEVSEGFKVTLSAPTNGVLGAVKEVTGTIVDDGRTLPGGGTADDDRPGFSINDLIIDESAGTVTFTVTRTGDLTQAASVDYAPQNGSATGGGVDFNLTGGTLNFAPNMATQTITVTINNDGTYEGPEGFVINLSNPVGAVITDGQGAGTIVDNGTGVPPGGGTPDDDRPTISVGSDFTVDEAAGTITFTVTKTGSTSLPATVSFTTQDGTAIAGSDYSPASGTLTFAAGETTKQVTVSITNDAIYEGAQDFNLVISNPVNAKLGDAVQTVTIVDDGTGVPPGGGTPDDDRPVFTIGNDLIIDEKAGTATFTVTKTGATTLTSSVSFGTSDAGATAGQDYTANNGVLTFGANETTKTITIQIANDTTYEVSEGFKVTLSAPTNGVLGAVKEVTGTIVDDGRTLPGGGTADDDRPGFSINDLIIDESAGTVTFTVTRTGDLTQAASVDYAPQNGSATGGGVDFNLTGGTLNFAPNMATQTITVTINNDGTYEGPEGFVINLSNPVGAVITDGQGAGTIVDNGTGVPPGGGTPDDDRPTISVGSDFTVDEAAGTITFTVTKTGSTSLPATVSFTTQDGTAIAGSDYSPASGTLTFAAGETTKQVTVSITNDAIYEGAQDFNLVISNPVNAKLGDAVQTVTIVDDGTGVPPGGGTPDDDRPVFTIGNDLIIDEKAGTATFTVTKTGATTLTSSVSFGTSDAGATAGQDYTANNGVLTFGANETTKTITIQIANDTTYEVSEGFKVTLSAPTNGVLGAVKEVTGTIVDDGRTLPGGGTADDDRPGFSINDLIIDESAGTVTFTVTRTGDLTQAASVDYAPQNGSATGGGVDFNLTGGTLTFAPNMATQTITVTINNDGTYEGPEGFVINLSNPVGAVITDGQGAGTIVDNGTGVPPGGGTPDDDRPTISVGSDFTVDEAAGTITFTVTKTGSTSLPATVSFTTQDGTAIAGSDYSPASGTLTFAAGETTKQVTVNITNDAIYEGAQDFNLVISNPVNAKLGDAVQTVTIVDDGTGVPPGGGTPDDDRPVFTIGNDLIIDEKAGTATFTVTKTGATTLTSSVSFGTSDAGATAGQDYTANNGVLTFGANETTKTITIQIANDTTYEVSEGFKVTLSAPTNGVLGAVKEVTGTIVDDGRTLPGGGTADDDRPGFSINDLIIDESAGTVTFTVTRTGDLTQAASVDYAPQNGSATGGGVDFNLTGGTLTFAPNMATQTITVTINNDGTYEGPEGFVINLSNPVGAVITDGQGAGTIVDNGTGVPPGGGTPDDDRPTISVGSDFTVDEAAGTITFTVTKTGSTSLPATVSFTTQDGTAIAGSDYSPASGTLTFAAGETTKQVTVSITNDAIYEGAQDFNLVISNPVNAKLGDAVQTVTIVDDGTGVPPGGGTPDDDRPVFTIGNDLIIDEKAGTATFTVTKTGATTLTSSVSFGTSDAGATAGQDYTANNGVLTFGANETTKTITIQIANDTTYEVSEGFKVTLSAPTNGVLGAVKEVTGTIVDDGRTLPGGGTADDDRPGFSINDLIIDESAGTVTFTVTRTGDLTQAASVDYAPQNGSATGGGVDFNLTGGTLSFAPNMATQTITVTINNDGTYEGPEGFVINLSNPVGAVITDGQGAGTIVDVNRPPVATADNYTMPEDGAAITLNPLAGDSDPDGGSVRITNINGTALTPGVAQTIAVTNGTVNISAAGVISFTPAANFHGEVRFPYGISDGQGGTATADQVITVTSVNDLPFYSSSNITIQEDVPRVLLRTDFTMSDIDGTIDSIRIGSVAQGQLQINVGGVWQVVANGSTVLMSAIDAGNVRFVPTADYNGTNALISFRPIDNEGGERAVYAGLNIDVVAVADIAPDLVTTNEDTLINIAVNTNDSFENAAHTITAINGTAIVVGGSVAVANGTVTLNANGTLDFMPAANYNNTAATPTTFTYTVSSGGVTETATVSVVVNSVNDLPVAVTDNYTMNEDGAAITLNPLTGDSDPDGGVLSVASINGIALTPGFAQSIAVTNGTVNITAAGVISFTPAANFNGTISFPYVISDGQGGAATANQVIVVNAVNDAPVANNDAGAVNEDATLTVSAANGVITSNAALPGRDTDVDGDALTVSAVRTGLESGSGTSGTVGSALIGLYGTLILRADGSYTYAADQNAADGLANGVTANDIFTYTVSDGKGGTDLAQLAITVTGTNDAPVVGSASLTLSEEGIAGKGLADTVGNPTDTSNASSVSGVISIVDLDNTPTVTLSGPAGITSGGVAVTWSGNGTAGSPLVGSAGGVEVIRATIDSSGNYTVSLSKGIDHPSGNGENLTSFNFTVSATDGLATTTGTLAVTVEDDSPNAIPATQNVFLPTQDTNVMLVLDLSGSMAGTKLTTMKQSVETMLNQYDNLGDVMVRVVTFGSSASAYQTSWISVSAAITYVNGLSANLGNTNYDAALLNTMSAFTSPGKIAGAQNVSYFLTDGDPTANTDWNSSPWNYSPTVDLPASNGIQNYSASTTTEEGIWRNFLEANDIKSFAYGMGTGATQVNMDPIAYDGVTGTNTNSIVVANVADLPPILRDSIVTPTGGDLTSGTLGAGSGLGGDGGYLASFSLNGTTYNSGGTSAGTVRGTYDATSNSWTVQTTGGGKFVVDMDTGLYTYAPPVGITVAFNESVGYILRDMDGDTAASTLTISVNPPIIETLVATTSAITGTYNLGLAGEYFGYNDNRTGQPADNTTKYSGATRIHSDDGTVGNVDLLADVEAIVEGRNGNPNLINNAIQSSANAADATFSANKLEFGFSATGGAGTLFADDLGQNRVIATSGTTIGQTTGTGSGNNNLNRFLQGTTVTNADSIAVTSGLGDTTDAIIRMVGYINIPLGGTYDLRVTADDGYRILIGGSNLAQLDNIQSTTTHTYTGKVISEGLQTIEVLYWDQGGSATLRVEIKETGAADTTYKTLGTDDFALFTPNDYAALNLGNLTANQDIVESATNGVYQIRTGETYVGSDAPEKIIGSDGRDTISTGGGADTINGGAGSDTISGGAGNDTMTGGLGSDTFVWTLADQGTASAPARDVITDFNVASKAAGGDILDLHDLLTGTATSAVSLDNYLNFSKSGNDTVIDVRPNGASGAITQQIVLSGVDLTSGGTLGDQAIIQSLLNNGKLITD